MKSTLLSGILFLLFGVGILAAQAPFEIQAVEMTIDGTSSLHDWTSEVTEVNAEGKLHLADGALKSVEGLTVTIPVTSIKSGKGSVMDNKTYDAFDSEQHPTIVYKLKEVRSITRNGDAYSVETRGDLSMAGTTKSIDMTVKGEHLGNGDIRFQGSKPLDMTEWEMAPPTAMFGTLKTGKDITINFAMTVRMAKS